MAWGFSFGNFDLQSARFTGCTNRAGGSPLTGGSFFLHRKAGVLEPRRRFALTGGEFFTDIQRGIRRLRTAGTVPRPAAGAKRKGHLRFPFLFELLPFPYLIA